MHRVIPCLFILFFASVSQADTIRLKNGNTLEGVILKEDAEGVVIRLKYGTTLLQRSEIESIERSTPDARSPRLASWEKCYEVLASRPWTSEWKPASATVIDKGLLRYVPYLSSRAGDYEFNIYGNPDRPADLEMGISKESLKRSAAKTEAVAVLGLLLSDPRDLEILRSLDLRKEKDRKESAGLVFEFEQEADAAGTPTWWLTVYSPVALDKARLSKKEIDALLAPPDEKTPPETSPAPTNTPRPAPPSPDPSGTPNPAPMPQPMDISELNIRRSYSRGRSYKHHRPKSGSPPSTPR